MNLSWLVLAIVFIANLGYIIVLLIVQEMDWKLPPRYSTIQIPGTHQKFLHIFDFYTLTWGCITGVPLIFNAFVHLVMCGLIDPQKWITFVGIAVISSVIFAGVCLNSKHKPDMGFPKIGKISWVGIIHLPYLGIGIASTILCLRNIFSIEFSGPVYHLFVVGISIYTASLLADIKCGNFNPLKKV
jgi:hypothetical protein